MELGLFYLDLVFDAVLFSWTVRERFARRERYNSALSYTVQHDCVHNNVCACLFFQHSNLCCRDVVDNTIFFFCFVTDFTPFFSFEVNDSIIYVRYLREHLVHWWRCARASRGELSDSCRCSRRSGCTAARQPGQTADGTRWGWRPKQVQQRK